MPKSTIHHHHPPINSLYIPALITQTPLFAALTIHISSTLFPLHPNPLIRNTYQLAGTLTLMMRQNIDCYWHTLLRLWNSVPVSSADLHQFITFPEHINPPHSFIHLMNASWALDPRFLLFPLRLLTGERFKSWWYSTLPSVCGFKRKLSNH